MKTLLIGGPLNGQWQDLPDGHTRKKVKGQEYWAVMVEDQGALYRVLLHQDEVEDPQVDIDQIIRENRDQLTPMETPPPKPRKTKAPRKPKTTRKKKPTPEIPDIAEERMKQYLSDAVTEFGFRLYRKRGKIRCLITPYNTGEEPIDCLISGDKIFFD